MKLKELSQLLKNAVQEGAGKALAESCGLPDQISKAEAYRLYGRSDVDRWLLEGLVKISNKRIDKIKLDRVAAASNRITYLPVAER